jgi:hypothetical protein
MSFNAIMMNHRWLVRFATLVMLIPLQGCLVWRYTNVPPVSGVVVDAESKQPINAAKVGFRECGDVVRYTSSDGSFNLPGEHEWRFCPLIPGDYWPRGTLFVEAPGHRTSEKWISKFGGTHVKLSDPIQLKRR